ncbi:aspartate aminotransferase family protein [Parenemella sanctibonifatiensis]|uniref:Aspartate aminotransferase family protein n=1 Tax=Parenemella sanctibonifatiensis TaxID=2016505 RepID=A0A255EIM0_9ACTN|nr:glutamate-1-semialdehyde 2,1-aminomutase [Parenemella sanctibonifatiensis]OYN91378.1 aspartate aminotransferase family protein [Parenemella sanctibonifatiensis]
MTSAARRLAETAEQIIPGGVNSATRRIAAPWSWKSAHGATITDLDGNDYIDYHAAFGAILLGHTNERVNAAVSKAITDIDLVGLGTTELEVEAAQLIVDAIPSAEMTISTMSGSEATFQAVRLARGATHRPFILKFQGCFHGSYDAIARNVISPAERAWQRDPNSSGILDDAVDHTLIAEFNDLASVEELFASHPEQIAAVILEPVPHNVGAVIPDQSFLEGLREITRRDGSLLIFDEVITGFRHALGGYQELCGVMPDLTTFGKSMGNGFPVAGLAGTREVMSNFTPAGGTVMLAGTFNGNAASMAAAIATITALQDPEVDFYGHVRRLGDRMRSGLQEITDDLGVPAQMAGIGSVFVAYFLEGEVKGYRDLLRNNDEAQLTFHRRMIDQGSFMYPMALKRNHISLAHTEQHVDETLSQAQQVLGEMAREGLFRTAAAEPVRA